MKLSYFFVAFAITLIRISSVQCFTHNLRRISALGKKIDANIIFASSQDGSKIPFMKEVPTTAREMASFKNKIPFSEDIYVHLKFVIEVLSAKMKNKDAILSESDAEKFVDAVAEIIADGRKYAPPPRPVKSAEDETN